MKIAKYTNDPVAINYGLRNFPYFILNMEQRNGNGTITSSPEIADYRKEIRQIKQYYLDYEQGADFQPEGNGGHYVSSDVRFKTIRTLINKEARFMFSQTPDIFIKTIGDKNEAEKKQIEQYQEIFNRVMKDSKFPKKLLLGAKDCLIGKRIACLVDISEQGQILIHFYNSLQFYYELKPGTEELSKLITFEPIGSLYDVTRVYRYLVNRYEVTDAGKVQVRSALYDSKGEIVQELVPQKELALDYIPAVVITNDGLLEQQGGVSDVEFLSDYESAYSRIANGDIDADRQNMNPVRFVVDMNSNTTKNLSNAAGSFWDLKSEQNQNEVHPQVGTLAPSMQHSEPVKMTLERIRSAMYGEIDVPDISQDGLLSGITSFKALKALYYPLTTLCNERMKTWKPAIEKLVDIVINLALMNINEVTDYYNLQSLSQVSYTVNVSENYALLDDETEEKATDISEVLNNIRSRKSYNEKWRKDELETDDDQDAELLQIAVENNMFDTLSANPSVSSEISRRYETKQVEEGIEMEGAKTSLGIIDEGEGTEAE